VEFRKPLFCITPTYIGLDVWTPKDDPNMPIALKPDGIPDSVIMAITGVGDEQSRQYFR